MRKKWGIRKLLAAAVTGVIVAQAAFVPVMADEVDSVAEELETVAEEELEGVTEALGELEEIQKGITADFSVTGSLDAGEAGQFAVDANGQLIVGGGAESLSASVDLSGITIDCAQYFDGESVLLKIPGLPKVLSYKYAEDADENSLLAQIAGIDTINLINSALRLVRSEMDTEAMAKFSEELAAAIAEVMNTIEFAPADEKECTINGETVTCQGAQFTLTKDFAKELLDKVLAVHYPTGQTIEEYFDLVFAVSSKSEDETIPASVKEAIDQFLGQMPDFAVKVYMYEDAVAEIDLEAEGSVMAIQFRGNQIGYLNDEIAINLDGEDMAVLNMSVADTGFSAALTVQGEEMGSVAAEMTETGINASLIVQGTEIGTLTVDMTEGTFEINSAMLPAPITGKFAFDGEKLTLSGDIMGLQIEINIAEGGTPVKPEGDVLELSTMTQEDFQSITTALGSLFGGASAQMTPAA